MGHVLRGIVNLPPPVVLLLAFLFPALEASTFIGFVVPGEIGVVLGGVVANQGKLPLWAVLLAAIGGAIIGDSIGYAVGARYGERILRRVPDRLIDDDKIKRAQETVRHYGGRAVFIGRFTAALRAIVPGTAGMSHIHYGKFLFWNALGGGIWAAAYVLIGYLAGSQYEHIEKYANYIGIGLVVVIVAYFVIRHFVGKRKAATAS
jgi:undecaprenyl-diphosphatase